MSNEAEIFMSVEDIEDIIRMSITAPLSVNIQRLDYFNKDASPVKIHMTTEVN